jgi:6-phosphogluconolactonase
MSDWQRFASRADLDAALAAHLARRLEADLAREGRASLAVSGGGTPRDMFRRLARCELPWADVVLTLVDERCVPTDHPDSNERMLRETLLQGPAAAATLLSLAAGCDAGDARALPALERELAAAPTLFSAVVLGMGGDGHTASWFPRAANLASLLDPTNPQRVATTEPVSAPHRRITLTLPAVLASREILLHITSEEKEAVLENAEQQNHPVAAILRQDTTPVTIWWAP